MEITLFGILIHTSIEQNIKHSLFGCPYGFDIKIKWRYNGYLETVNLKNVSQVHFNYEGMNRIAFESDFHQTGFWRDISVIESVDISRSVKLVEREQFQKIRKG